MQLELRTVLRNCSRNDRVIFLSIFLFALLPLLYKIGVSPFHGDESEWISDGIAVTNLILRGDFANAFWFSGPDYFQAQVPKYIIGFWLRIFGITSGEWRYWYIPPVDYGNGAVPPENVLTLARIPIAILGALTCALTFSVGCRLVNRKVGFVSALFLLSEPLWILSSRRAMTDTPAVFFSVLAVYLYVRYHQKDRYSPKAWLWAALLGGSLAMVVESKYSLFTFVFLVVLVELLCLVNRSKVVYVDRDTHTLHTLFVINVSHIPRLSRRALTQALLFLISLTSVFLLVNPYLWPDPVSQTMKVIRFWSGTGPLPFWSYPSFLSALAFMAGFFNSVFFPLFIGVNVGPTVSTWQFPGTFSTVPISVLFFVGLAVLLSSKRNRFATVLLSLWVAIYFVFISFSLHVYFDRYFLPLLPPVSIVAAVGFDAFLSTCKARAEKLLFSAFTLSLSILAPVSAYAELWRGLAPTTGNVPEFATLQESLNNPYVIILAFLYYLIFIVYAISVITDATISRTVGRRRSK